MAAKTLASASSSVILHDLTSSEDNQEVTPQVSIDSHYMNARVNSVAWSHNSK